MADLLDSAPAEAAPRTTGRALPAIAGGLALGALTGVAARAWMRLVSSDPEFSWSGSIAIVVLFAVAGLTQGIALGVRRRRWPRWAQTPLRVLAVLGGLLLGQGAGIVMLPALVTGSLAIGRTDWPRWARLTAATLAGVNAVAMLVAFFGELPVWRSLTGWVAMLCLYLAIDAGLALNLRPLDDGWHLKRRWIGPPLAVVAAAVVVIHVVGMIGG